MAPNSSGPRSGRRPRMTARLMWKEDLLTLRAECPVSLEEQPRVTGERALAAATVAVGERQTNLGREGHSVSISCW